MRNTYRYSRKRDDHKRNIILGLAAILVILAIGYDLYSAMDEDRKGAVEGISESIIRFHVIANSDGEQDQAVKIKVKDAVVEKMQSYLQNATSLNESREIILNHIEDIKGIAENTLAENGFKETVTVNLELENFPLKQYGDIVLPPGEYEALIVRIGKAEGKNWWCVLFPPLCFVDATHGVIDDESKEGLKEVLTEEEYNSILMSKDDTTHIKVKSKLWEWFESKEKDWLKNTIFASFIN